MNIKMRTALKLLVINVVRITENVPYMDTKTARNCYDITDISRNFYGMFFLVLMLIKKCLSLQYVPLALVWK